MTDLNQNQPQGNAHLLVQLCACVLPVWARQLASSRAQSETAVSEMLQAFADIGPHINMAERQSQQITDALNPNEGGITGLTQACEATLSPLLQDKNLPAGGAEAIAKVLEMVRGAVTALENISKPFTRETQLVAEQVERMYVGFQYQDRISQMMALLEGDIARLREAMDGQSAVLDPAAWLERLESQYAMSEQRHNHSEPAGPATGADDNTETTFF